MFFGFPIPLYTYKRCVSCKVISDSRGYLHIFKTFSISFILDLCHTFCSAFGKVQAITIFTGGSFVIDVWQDSKYTYVSISATQLEQLFQVPLKACSGIFKHYSRAYSRIFRTLYIIRIFKILTYSYHKAYSNSSTKLNVFTKAQSGTFDTVLGAPLFYRCYLTSTVTLRLSLALYFQTYSGILKTYSVIFSLVKAY